MERLIILDTETTGGRRRSDRVIELGMVEMINGVTTGREFHSLFDTNHPIHWAAAKVHGLSSAKLKGHPRFDRSIPRILDFIEDSRCVAHNAPFDAGMMNDEFDRAGISLTRPDFLCTIKLASTVVNGSCALDALISRFLPGTPPRGKHSAIEDARILSRVLIRIMEDHPKETVNFLSHYGNVTRLKPVLPLLDRIAPRAPAISRPKLNAGVAEMIAFANNNEVDADYWAGLRTGRDDWSRAGRDDLVRSARELHPQIDLNAFLRELGPERALSGLRYVCRGLAPNKALEREAIMAEHYDRSDPRI